MVNEEVTIYDKRAGLKRFAKVFLVILVLGLICFAIAYTIFDVFIAKENPEGINLIVLNNPLKSIISSNTNSENITDKEKIIEEGVLEFNESYIDYILIALGVENLHKSVTLENPKIEVWLDGEVWNSEIVSQIPETKKGEIEEEDIRLKLTKEVIVKAMIEENLKTTIKNSVINGEISIEQIAGEAELFSKGYLNLYNSLKEQNN